MKKKILNRCLAFSLSFTMLLTSVYPSVVFAEENANMQNPTESDSSVLEEVDETLNTSNDISGDSKNVNSEEESIIHLPENSDSITNDSTEDDDSDIVSENSGLFTDAVYYEETTFNDANTSSSILAWPVPGYQMNYNRGYHDDGAIDISGVNSEGTGIAGAPIVAAYSGTVIKKFSCTVEREFILVNGKYQSSHVGEPTCYGYGTGLVILGDDGRYYKYAHMQAGSIPAEINEGSRITIGQQIGQVGQTGAADGAHLHFGISAGENWWDTTGINPANEDYSYKADQEAPVISSVNASNIACTTTSDGEVKAESFHINFNVSDNVGVTSAWVSIYEFGYTESAAKTYNCTISNGVASVTIPLSDFNYPGPLYGNCYAVDEAGNKQGAHIDDQLKFYPATECTGTYVVTKSGGSPIRYVPYASVNGNDTKVGTTSYKEKVEVVGYYTNSYDHIWYQLADGNWIYDGNLELLTTYVVNEGAKIVAKTCPGYGLFYLAGQLAAWGKGLLSSKASASSTNAVYNSAGSSTDADGSSTEAAGSAEEQTYEAGSYDTGIVNLNYSLLYSGTAYTVTFDGNGGYTETTSKTVYGGSPYGYFPTPYRFGYNFDGWFTSADGGDQITSSSTASGNITLYAHWTRIVLLSGKCGDNLDFILYGDGELDITGTGEMTSHPWTDNYKDIVLNVVIDNGATSICESAFYKCSYLYNVSMPESLLTIGARAFAYCGYLETVKFPEGLTKIDAGAFGECAALTSVNLPKSLVELNAHAFYNCDKLNSIEIPKSLTTSNSAYINEFVYNYQLGPFYGCDGLKKVTFESGITNIASGLFANCPGLETIVIPDTVNIIGNSAFNKAANLKSVSFGKGLTTIESMAFAYCKALDTAEIPDSVTKIDSGAFGQCTELSKVKLSKSLKEMNAHAFYNCDKLAAIEIPKSLTTSKDAYINEFVYNYQLGPFYGCDGLKTVTFELGITNIAPGLFANCPGLENIIIPDTVTTIGGSAFLNSSGLKSIILGKNLTKIGDNAFKNCTALEAAELPDSVTMIQNDAFNNCDSLEAIVLPDSVSSFGERVFQNCDGLKTVKWNNTLTSIPYASFSSAKNLEQFTFSEGIVSINNDAFKNCENLKSIELPSTLKAINDSAFYNCDALTEVVIPDSVTTLGGSAFKDSDNLVSVKLSKNLTTIETSVFEHCDVLSKIVIPYRVTNIKANAFNNCVALTEATIPKTVTTIAANAFSNFYQLTFYGIAGTYAEEYASANSIAFVDQQIHADSISLSETNVTLAKGASKALYLTIQPEGVTDDIAWKSSNTSVATIDDTGLVKAVGLGSTTIKVTVGSKSVSCKVTVVQPVTSIKLNSSEKTLEALDTFQLTAIVSPSDAANKEITWKSSNENVATVDENGLVTAIAKGTASITAEAQDGSGVTAACKITVSNTAYIVSDISELESSHPYDSSCNDFWVYTLDDSNAKSINVTFDAQTDIEEDFDYLYVYDENGTEVGVYTGTELAGKTISITGRTVRIKLVSDDSGTAWGFKVISVVNPDAKPAVTNPFTDVKKSDYFYDAVLWAVENGITGGTTASTFSPNQECTRQQVVMFLWRYAGKPEPTTTKNPFTDVKSSSSFYKAIMWAVETGITSGSTKNTFSPNATCTRQQIAMFLWRYAGKPAHSVTKNPFTDVNSSGTYYNAIMWAVENGITSGKTAATFLPTQECTRAQIVTFLYRMNNIS